MSAYVQNLDALFFDGDGVAQWDYPGEASLATPAIVFAGLLSEREEQQIDEGIPAYVGASWTDAYYSRLHVLPASINAGLISSENTIPITLWNASLESETITQLLGSDVEGMSISGLDAPRALAPNEDITVDLIVLQSGPPVIDGFFVFDASVERDGRLDVSGVRALVFAHQPDWAERFKVGRVWETVTSGALSTKEDRLSMAAKARRKVGFRVLSLSQTETARWRNWLLGRGETPIGFPLWPEAVKVAAQASAGDVIVYVDDTELHDFDAPYVLLWTAHDAWQVRGIVQVASGSVTVDTPLGSSLPVGAFAVPLLFGRMETFPELSSLTDELASAEVSFVEEYNL